MVEASYTSLDAATMTVKVWSADGSFHVTAGDHLATLTVGAKTRVEIPTAGRYLIAITAETGSIGKCAFPPPCDTARPRRERRPCRCRPPCLTQPF